MSLGVLCPLVGSHSSLCCSVTLPDGVITLRRYPIASLTCDSASLIWTKPGKFEDASETRQCLRSCRVINMLSEATSAAGSQGAVSYSSTQGKISSCTLTVALNRVASIKRPPILRCM